MTNKPLNVLVVDDELPIRQELRAFPWDACGARWAGEAENGEEALTLCARQPPDVIVSDITMPIMDGLTFVKEVRRRYPGVQIILLTCHSDFRFAQEAIRIGALEYILKVSMDEEELLRAIAKAREAIERETDARRQEARKREARKAKALESLLRGVKGDGAAAVDGGARWETLDIGDRFPLRCVRLRIRLPADDPFAFDELLDALTAFERQQRERVGWLALPGEEFALFFPGEEPEPSVADRLIQLFSSIAEAVGSDAAGRAPVCRAWIAGVVRTREEALAKLGEQTDWIDWLFYERDDEPIVLAGSPQRPLGELSERHRKFLRVSVQRSDADPERLLRFFRTEFPAWCARERIRPDALKRWLIRWWTEWLSEREREGGAAQRHWHLPSFAAADSLEGLSADLESAVRAVQSSGARLRPEIREAKRHIKEHLHEALSLARVAEHVGLSPEYVSRLFKDETGESVNQYITRLRMEKAMELLQHSTLRVYEIAEAVGIPNYRYFASTFRNWTGIAPTDFKSGRSPEPGQDGGRP
ncbi:response regulator [Paenibacillus sp.]|uniref:response regulator n=1 Tax=Paenibacillus sp. TaxID=58172 RepID=UPI002D2ACEB6|nr:response regulator [Paenibacillus sp.]HZG87754.1 response regulator [Paenibacillus sp.]